MLSGIVSEMEASRLSRDDVDVDSDEREESDAEWLWDRRFSSIQVSSP